MPFRVVVLSSLMLSAVPAAATPCGPRGPISHLKASGPKAIEMCMAGATRTCWAVDLAKGTFTKKTIAEKSEVIEDLSPVDAVADIGPSNPYHNDQDPLVLKYRACHPLTKKCQDIVKPADYTSHAVTGDGKYIVVAKKSLLPGLDGPKNVSALVETLQWEDLSSVAKLKEKYQSASVRTTGPLVTIDYIECEGIDCDGSTLNRADNLKAVGSLHADIGSGSADFRPLATQPGRWLVIVASNTELKDGHIVSTPYAQLYDHRTGKMGKSVAFGWFMRENYEKHRREPPGYKNFDIPEILSYKEGPGYSFLPTTSGTIAIVLLSPWDDGLAGDVARFSARGGLKYFRFPECPDRLPIPKSKAEDQTSGSANAAKEKAKPLSVATMMQREGVWRGGGVTLRRDGKYIVVRNREGGATRTKNVGFSPYESFRITSVRVEAYEARQKVAVDLEVTLKDGVIKKRTMTYGL